MAVTERQLLWTEAFLGISPAGATPTQTSMVARDATNMSGVTPDGAGMSGVTPDGAGFSAVVPEPNHSDAEGNGDAGARQAASDHADDADDDPPLMSGGVGGRGGRGGPPAAELDEGEGKNRDGTTRRKAGDHGRARGTDAKRAHDAAVDEAVRDFGLTPDEQRELHDEIGGRNLGRDTVRQIAAEIAKRRKPGPQPTPETAPEAAPESEGPSTLERVAALVALLGLSVLLIPTIVAAIADPEPISKLALAGLTAAEIGAIAAAFGIAFSGVLDADQPPPEA